MTCVVCKNKKMTRGTTVLPIERGKAVLLVTDIPARICANCGEPYIDEKIAKEVEALANEELNGLIRADSCAFRRGFEYRADAPHKNSGARTDLIAPTCEAFL